MSAKFKVMVENDDGWSDWVFPTPRKHYKMKCCGCDLVHDLEFEVMEIERKRGGWLKVVQTLNPQTHWLRFRARRA